MRMLVLRCGLGVCCGGFGLSWTGIGFGGFEGLIL